MRRGKGAAIPLRAVQAGQFRFGYLVKGENMLKEFKDFAMKGNVIDLAFAVIMGGAFGKIIDSLVADIIMPIIGSFGNADFSNYFIKLNSAIKSTNLVDAKKEGPVLAWGNFVTFIINFLIVAFVLFLIVKAMNSMKKKEAAIPQTAPPPPPRNEVLLEQIRDLLARR